jgi:trimeric autotransporter adhesin
VNGNGSYAIGDPNTLNGSNTFALGDGNTVNNGNAAGWGDNIQVVGSGNTIAGTASAAGSSVLGNGNIVNATNAIAIGNSISVTGANAVAIGQGSSATADNSVALGFGSTANVANTVSVGAPGSERKIVNVADGTIGTGSTDAITGGQLMTANQRVAAAFGSGAGLDANGQLMAPSYTIQNVAYNNVGSAFGAVDSALSTDATSIAGLQTQVNNGSIGLVQQNAATRDITVGAATDGTVVNMAGTAGNRTVTGVAAGALTSAGTDAVNGSQLYATNQQVAANTTAISNLSSIVSGLQGGGSSYVKINSTGASASATGANASAIGSGSNASGDNALAFGTDAQATQNGAIAIGLNASSTGANAIAIGTGASATGSVAVGNAASAANGGAAFGDGAVATGTNAAALGANASATAANSVSIGSGSTNTVANTVSFGSAGNERRLTNVAAGINPTDAVNVGQLQSTVAGFQSQIGGLQNEVAANQQEARRGIVAAVAVAPVLMPSAPGKTTLAVNTGYYRGETGVGIGVSHRLNFALPTVVYGSYSNGGGSEHIGRAGMAVEF